jgi:urease accessory protein UreF
LHILEIEKAIVSLPVEEVEELRNWLEDYLEDQLKFTDEFAQKVKQAQTDISTGKGRIQFPEN